MTGPASLLAVALSGPARAISPGDDVWLYTVDGEVVQGAWLRPLPGWVVLTGEQDRRVPLTEVLEVRVKGADISVDRLHAELDAAWQGELAWRADPPPHPAPGVPAAASFAWAGLGHALVGEGRQAWRWAAVDAGLVGAALLTATVGAQPGAALTIGVVDLFVRGAAAGASARVARRTRARLLPEPAGP